ncbi:hypothetical protein B0T16DRAFT_494404 [Cercophora newfieldiana]|uniref:AB hydrolase-1 domain-containing protein n=1 Tax=Cercophora newfieldiana TaxID=92897 RepID=A0AA39Y1F1_9PEZI|nr:hypothetical protein B0T16DRAFT_494404 [Cercophora newfieldiana]
MASTTAGDHSFDADDVRLHYRLLEAHFTMVYFEPHANGLSSKPSDEPRMSSTIMAHDLEHLRKELGLEAFPALFGHSNGGSIATAYAIMYPEINGGTPTDNFIKFAEKRKDDPIYGPALQALIGASAHPL